MRKYLAGDTVALRLPNDARVRWGLHYMNAETGEIKIGPYNVNINNLNARFEQCGKTQRLALATA